MIVQFTQVGRALIIVAATVIALAGIHVASSILSPLLLAMFFATLSYPLYAWMRRRGMSAGLALGLLALVLVGIVASLGLVVWISVEQLVANLATYEKLLEQRLAGLRERLASVDLSAADLPTRVDASLLIGLLIMFVGDVTGLTLNFFFVVLTILFLVADGPAMMGRLQNWLGADYPLVRNLEQYGPAIQQYFGLRSYLNALTGLITGIGLWLLGVDFALLWAVAIFFLSYVPYIGAFLGAVPPVVLALAEHGLGRALAVIALVTVINMVLENIVMPRIMGRGFSLSPFVVFAAFAFWIWLIGPTGALLAVALTQLLVLVLESFPETCGIAGLLKNATATQPAADPEASAAAGSPGEQRDVIN